VITGATVPRVDTPINPGHLAAITPRPAIQSDDPHTQVDQAADVHVVRQTIAAHGGGRRKVPFI
jgi:hypothetical protein